MRSHLRTIIVLLLMSLAAVACSGAASTTSAPGSVGAPNASAPPSEGTGTDPCTLVTAADAATALGGSVQPSTSSFTGIYQSCSYATDSGATLIVTSRSIDRSGFDAAAAQPPSKSPLANVCQDAYTVGSDVWAWQNGTEIDARFLILTGVAQHMSLAEQLIETACSRV